MAFEKTAPEATESVIPGDERRMWFLKDELGTDHVAFTVLEMEPDTEGKEHSHSDQEELYYVEEGGVDIAFGERTVGLEEGEVMRIDPEERRQILNRDHFSRLILVGAPRDAE